MPNELDALIAWLRKRAEPNSGIRYVLRGFDDNPEVILHGTDATFIKDHFHGKGAAALADALAALPEREGLSIKPLVWTHEAGGLRRAKTPFGYSYFVNPRTNMWLGLDDDWSLAEGEATAAAQADYESRIRSALSAPAERGVEEPDEVTAFIAAVKLLEDSGWKVVRPGAVPPPPAGMPEHAQIYVGHGLYAKVDWDDWDTVKGYKWHTTTLKRTPVYAIGYDRETGKDRKKIYLHQLLLRAPEGMVVDHINRDSLDNRRSNLRIATRLQNSHNSARKRADATSIYRGVSRDGKQWRAVLKNNKKTYSLGRFDAETDAALAYNEAARMHHGEFAVLNEIPLAAAPGQPAQGDGT